MQALTRKQALVILPGLTANRDKLLYMERFFAENTTYAVYIPRIPKRRGLKMGTKWLATYFRREVQAERYDAIDVLAYISGGYILRNMAVSQPLQRLQHVIYVRSPIQERTLTQIRARYGYLSLLLMSGKLALDVVALDPGSLDYPVTTAGQGLIIETGISNLALSIGIDRSQIPATEWDPATLLPDANDVIHVPESHDDMYTSPYVLKQALHFFDHDRFQQPSVNSIGGDP